MRTDHHKDVDAVLAGVPAIVPRVDPGLLRIFLEELLSWNPQLGLISKQRPPHVAAQLLRRSTALWDFVVENTQVDPAARVVDIGTGGGFPGVVWKLLAPELKIILLERKGRRAFFLERLAFRLNVDDMEIIHGDIRDTARLAGEHGAYDIATMMAVSPPERLAAAVGPILTTGGVFCCIRGSGSCDGDAVGGGLALAAEATGEDARFVLYRKS